jgi:hypothetical protein
VHDGFPVKNSIGRILWLVCAGSGLCAGWGGWREICAYYKNLITGRDTMKKIFVVIAVAAGLAFSARPAFLQTERPDAQHEHGTRGGGMMQGGMMCPMMGMGGMGMMGESGGMMGGMGGMMGGRGGDPKMMAQMMQMRGEMMMKMGEVMMKHGKMMQQGQTK